MSIRITILVMVALSSCGLSQESTPDSITYSTPDPKYMKELARQLRSNNIAFHLEGNGAITYAGVDGSKVEGLHARVMNRLNGNAVRYEPNEVNIYLRKLLKERKVEYEIEKREEGEWTRWFPENDAQEQEVQELVRQFTFRDTTDGKCKAGNGTSNNALNTDAAKERRAC